MVDIYDFMKGVKSQKPKQSGKPAVISLDSGDELGDDRDWKMVASNENCMVVEDIDRKDLTLSTRKSQDEQKVRLDNSSKKVNDVAWRTSGGDNRSTRVPSVDEKVFESSPPKSVENGMENLGVKSRKVSDKSKTSYTERSKDDNKVGSKSNSSTNSMARICKSTPSITDILASIPDATLPEDSGCKTYKPYADSNASIPSSGSGAPDIPEAKPNCLLGITMVFTGVLPNMDRDSAEALAKQYGAKVTKAISGKTTVVVLGDDAGPSKVSKIKQLKTKAIDEDGFIQLLKGMPSEGGDSDRAALARAKLEAEQVAIEKMARADEAESRRKEQMETNKLMSGKHGAEALPRLINNNERLWTDKHAPASIQQLCGNKSQIAKLERWLSEWFENARLGFKSSSTDGLGKYRAVLISGPPGIGKTSAAHLVAHKLGYDVLEKNASDVRSKLLLQQSVKQVLTNTSVVGYFKGRQNDDSSSMGKRFCLIMDEVDGMLSGDNGGAGALLSFCKVTSMPIILICNDKSLPKMRTFDYVAYDMAFRRPSETDVRSRLMSIALREGIKLDASIIGQLVQATGNDMRQMINMLATVLRTVRAIGLVEAVNLSQTWRKHTVLKPFDVCARLLGMRQLLLSEQIDLYFNDMDMTPLMVQENYLTTQPQGILLVRDHLRRAESASNDISLLDGINAKIRSSEQQWSLLPFHAVMLLARPCFAVGGRVTGRINFSLWLGQNSKLLKMQRWLTQVQCHARLHTLCDTTELRLDYIPLWILRMGQPLVSVDASEVIESVMAMMDYYYLTKEDWDSIMEMGVGPHKDVPSNIPSKIKSAFTRAYNCRTHPVAVYKSAGRMGSAMTIKTDAAPDYEGIVPDDTIEQDHDSDAVEDDGTIDMKRDKLIKAVPVKKGRKRTSAVTKATSKRTKK